MEIVINKLSKFITEKENKYKIDCLEEVLEDAIGDIANIPSFYELPTENVLRIIEKSKTKDVKIIKTLVYNFSKHKGKEAPLILNVIDPNNANFDEYVEILSNFQTCPIFKHINKYIESEKAILKQDYEKENKELRQKIAELEKDTKMESNDYIKGLKSSLIEQDILNVNEENIDEIFNKIKENFTTFTFVTGFIEYALKIRPNQTDYLISLLSKISKVSDYNPYKLSESQLELFKNKSLPKGESTNSGKEKHYERGSIYKTIKEDSVDKLIKTSQRNSFDPKGKIKISLDQSINFVTGHNEFTYMQIMAYYGSIKCFKYALMDGSFDERGVTKFAVAGGNYEILKLLEQREVDFEDCFDVSVKFHRYEISDMLIKKYQCEVSLSRACDFYNNNMLSFLIQNKTECTQGSINSALVSSSRTGNLEIVKYFVEHCHAEADATDNYGRMPLNVAISSGHIDVVKYLVEHCHANIEIENISGRTPLNDASYNGYIEIVKYLVEHCHANIETKDIRGRTPLSNASRNSHTDIAKYLISKGAK